MTHDESSFPPEKGYLNRLQMAIRHLHLCESNHLETVYVQETFQGETVWEGKVEVFAVCGLPRAKKCYAWSTNPGMPNERFTVILELPLVRCAADAVRVSILAAAQKTSG